MTADRRLLYADLSRVGDSRLLTDVLDAVGCTPDQVLTMTRDEWRYTAEAAGRRGRPVPMPDDATKSLVWARLTERRRLDSTSPLQDLPR